MYIFQIQSPDAQGVRGVQQAKAKKFFSSARDSSLMKFCGFLHDTVGHLSSLSASLQKSGITVAEAHSSLVATKTVLEKYRTRFVIILLFVIYRLNLLWMAKSIQSLVLIYKRLRGDIF